MDARLQRLRCRVQRGERLSEAELRSLRRAAAEEGWTLAEALAGSAAKPGRREQGGLRATWTDELTGTDDVLAQVVPVLSEAAGPGLLSREGPAGLEVTHLGDGAALSVASAPASLEAVDRAAWGHLEARAAELRPVIIDRGQPRLSPEPLGLWARCEADGADGARLLTREQRRRLFDVVGPGPYRVSLARPELALVAQLLDSPAVALLESMTPAPEGIRGRFVLHPGGMLERLFAG